MSRVKQDTKSLTCCRPDRPSGNRHVSSQLAFDQLGDLFTGPRSAQKRRSFTRFVNIGIDCNGIAHISMSLVAEELLGQAIPMKGRMIHHNDGR